MGRNPGYPTLRESGANVRPRRSQVLCHPNVPIIRTCPDDIGIDRRYTDGRYGPKHQIAVARSIREVIRIIGDWSR